MMVMAKAKDEVKSPSEPTSAGILVGARDALAAYCESRNNMAAKDVLTALVYWFVNADPVVQRVAIGDVEDDMRSAYADALRKMADRLERGGGNTTDLKGLRETPFKPKDR